MESPSGHDATSAPPDRADAADTDAATDDDAADSESGRSRKRALLYTLPFLFVGVANVAFILDWGMDPIWGLALLPPVLFCAALAYLVFSTDFLDDRT
ncbi:hypothetical protein ACNS7O_14005 [Haloferacaceae archaeon DSL9]